MIPVPALVVLAAALPGCASWQPLAGGRSVAEQRAQRSQEVVQEFEQERSRMQLEAALNRWQQGDVAGCETRLRAVLAREPNHLEARLRLAELAWSEGDFSTAEAEYRLALSLAPDRKDIREALGLLLESQP